MHRGGQPGVANQMLLLKSKELKQNIQARQGNLASEVVDIKQICLLVFTPDSACHYQTVNTVEGKLILRSHRWWPDTMR